MNNDVVLSASNVMLNGSKVALPLASTLWLATTVPSAVTNLTAAIS